MAWKATAAALLGFFLASDVGSASAQSILRSAGEPSNPRAGLSVGKTAGSPRISTVPPRSGVRHGPGPNHGAVGLTRDRPDATDEGEEAEEDIRRYTRKRYRPYRRKFAHPTRAGQPIAIIDRYAPGLPPPEVIVITEPKEPEADEEEAKTPEVTPPPITSPRTVALARGRTVPPPPFQIGSQLPRSVPHVTLDWRTHGLPQPPLGQIYARVRTDVLLIDAATRRVIGMVDPATQRAEVY